MMREYKNQTIYKDLKLVKTLSLISLILSGITLLTFVFTFYAARKLPFDIIHAYFIALLLGIPVVIFTNTYDPRKPKINLKETKLNNDVSNLVTVIVFSFSDIILTILLLIIGTASGSMKDAYTAAFMLGYSFIAHMFSYTSAAILIHVLVLIKRELKHNPPDYPKEKEPAQESKNLSPAEKCNALLEKCGVRFFVKYLKGIQSLPLNEVAVEEPYSPAEKEERLKSAREIVDLELVGLALNEIIEKRGNEITPQELKCARTMLEELNNETAEYGLQKSAE